jgi:hypothetical protein
MLPQPTGNRRGALNTGQRCLKYFGQPGSVLCAVSFLFHLG